LVKFLLIKKSNQDFSFLFQNQSQKRETNAASAQNGNSKSAKLLTSQNSTGISSSRIEEFEINRLNNQLNELQDQKQQQFKRLGYLHDADFSSFNQLVKKNGIFETNQRPDEKMEQNQELIQALNILNQTERGDELSRSVSILSNRSSKESVSGFSRSNSSSPAYTMLKSLNDTSEFKPIHSSSKKVHKPKKSFDSYDQLLQDTDADFLLDSEQVHSSQYIDEFEYLNSIPLPDVWILPSKNVNSDDETLYVNFSDADVDYENMVQETQNFKKNFSYNLTPPPGLTLNKSKRQQSYPSAKTPSPTLLANSFANSYANSVNTVDSLYKSAINSTDKQPPTPQHHRQLQKQYSSEYEAKNRKNYLLNDFFPSFRDSTTDRTSAKLQQQLTHENKTKTIGPIGPIQRPVLTNSTSNPFPLFNVDANNTKNISATTTTTSNNLLDNFTSWLSNNFQNSYNLTSQLNLSPAASTIMAMNQESKATTPTNHMLTPSETVVDNANLFNEFKLFGTESSSPPKLNAFNTEQSIWNTNARNSLNNNNNNTHQPWNSVLINDINSLAPTQTSLLNSSSSGNRIKSLWSSSFTELTTPDATADTNSKITVKQHKSKKQP
jgi:hypothetical protein